MDKIHSRLDIIKEKIIELEDSPKKLLIANHRGKHDWEVMNKVSITFGHIVIGVLGRQGVRMGRQIERSREQFNSVFKLSPI